jgi:hypothetical protein
MHYSTHTKITFLCTLIFCCTMQGMMTDYPTSATLLQDQVRPNHDRVILEYDGKELDIPRSLAQQFPPIQTRLSATWDRGSQSIPRYKFLTQIPQQYGHKHILQLVNLCAQPEADHIITLDDLDPLRVLADELLVEKSVTCTFEDHLIASLNRTLADKNAKNTEKQKAISDYQKILQAQNDEETIKNLYDKAAEEGALGGMYHMMYTSPSWKAVMAEDSRFSKLKAYFIKQENSENPIISPQFHAWVTKDPAKQVFDILVQHKRSIRTVLEEIGIDITQSHLFDCWKQRYLNKTMSKEEIEKDKIIEYIGKIVWNAAYTLPFESIHDLYLLPVELFVIRSNYVTNRSNGKFLHMPLVAYLTKKSCSYYFCKSLHFSSLSQASIEPVDWESIHAHKIEDIKIGKNCKILTIPKEYETHYKQHERTKDNSYYSLIQFIHPITKRDIFITAGSLGLIGLALSTAYLMRQHVIPFIQTKDAHKFLHTHVTDTNRHIYQLLHQTSEKSFSSPCKAVLDAALPKLSANYKLDSDTVVQCNTNLKQLYTNDTLETSTADFFALWGYCFLPVWVTAAAWGTLKKTYLHTYSKLFGIKKAIAEQE